MDAADNFGAGNAATSVDITVNVYEVNDNPPECSAVSTYTYKDLPETTTVPSDVVDFSGCDDIDFGASQGWAVEIVSGNTGAEDGTEYFTINANKLQLTHEREFVVI